MTTHIIFDMNGVITDDEHCHEMATKEAFGTLGLNVSPDIYRTYCLGRTDVAAFTDLFNDFAIKQVDILSTIEKKTEIYLGLVEENLKIYPGVVECIQRLSSSYTLALTTSSTRVEVSSTLGLTGLTDTFDVILTAENVSKGKPDPEPYLLTLQELKAKASECMVIEDSENGIKSAKAAGIRCLAIPNTETIDKLALADGIFHNYSELTKELFDSL
ncbi:HAD family hydrolase [Euzebyella marina]|nr:HAD family phosphatase [Euzebyella marina]